MCKIHNNRDQSGHCSVGSCVYNYVYSSSIAPVDRMPLQVVAKQGLLRACLIWSMCQLAGLPEEHMHLWPEYSCRDSCHIQWRSTVWQLPYCNLHSSGIQLTCHMQHLHAPRPLTATAGGWWNTLIMVQSYLLWAQEACKWARIWLYNNMPCSITIYSIYVALRCSIFADAEVLFMTTNRWDAYGAAKVNSIICISCFDLQHSLAVYKIYTVCIL